MLVVGGDLGRRGAVIPHIPASQRRWKRFKTQIFLFPGRHRHIQHMSRSGETNLRLSLIQSFSLSPGSSIQLAKLSVSMEPSIACNRK